jgi:hypothetical protein
MPRQLAEREHAGLTVRPRPLSRRRPTAPKLVEADVARG